MRRANSRPTNRLLLLLLFAAALTLSGCVWAGPRPGYHYRAPGGGGAIFINPGYKYDPTRYYAPSRPPVYNRAPHSPAKSHRYVTPRG